jgi:hypothetical protein
MALGAAGAATAVIFTAKASVFVLVELRRVAPEAAKKSSDAVLPVTYVLPFKSTASPVAASSPDPPK